MGRGIERFFCLCLLLTPGMICANEDRNQSIKQIAPHFTLKDQLNQGVSLSDYVGKIIVLEWTNPHCPFVNRLYSTKSKPSLADIAWKYQQMGVIWLAINSTHYQTIKDNKAWYDQHKLSYPVLDDHLGKVGQQYQATHTPHIFIINPKGMIVYQGPVNSPPTPEKPQGINHVVTQLDLLLERDLTKMIKKRPYGSIIKYISKKR